jgi:predicted small lipoprotein YifL
MNRLIIALAALTMVFLASGCGQSGPLYIPDNPSTISVPAPAPASDSTDEEAEEENGDPQKD